MPVSASQSRQQTGLKPEEPLCLRRIPVPDFCLLVQKIYLCRGRHAGGLSQKKSATHYPEVCVAPEKTTEMACLCVLSLANKGVPVHL